MPDRLLHAMGWLSAALVIVAVVMIAWGL